MGATAAGGAAALGTGAFSRVESHRQVSVEVANDEDAYLGLSEGSSPNGDNYVEEDEHGHIEVDIADQPDAGGEGVNSNSLTFFDNLVEVCNQGKEDADVWLQEDPFTDDSGAAAGFYSGTAQGDGDIDETDLIHGSDSAIEVEVGTCEEIGLLVDTGGKFFDEGGKVDATEEDTIIDATAEITADVGDE